MNEFQGSKKEMVNGVARLVKMCRNRSGLDELMANIVVPSRITISSSSPLLFLCDTPKISRGKNLMIVPLTLNTANETKR